MLIQSLQLENILEFLEPDGINLLLIAEQSSVSIAALIKKANEKNIQVAGGIFPRIISNNKHYDEGIILKHFPSQVAPVFLPGIGKGNLDLELPNFDPGYRSCLVWVDGLMDNIPRLLERLYEKYWDQMHFVGGGCGSLTLRQKPCLFTNEGFCQDGAILIPLSSGASSGVTHGWQKVAGPFVANKTEANKIIELNWRPAYEVYKEVVESHSQHRFEEGDFFSVSKGFPFGIKKEGQEVIVRDPIAVDSRGVLTCVGHVSRNVSLYVLKGEADHLIESAAVAARKATSQGPYDDCLLIDCISRMLYLEDQFEAELNALGGELKKSGSVSEVEGALTLGEISSGNEGLLELYNKTTVVTTFK